MFTLGDNWLLSLAAIALALPLSAAEPPSLSSRLAGKTLVLSWPAHASGTVLEETDHLQPPVPWRAFRSADLSTDPPSLALPLQDSPTPRYYRLRSGEPAAPRITGEWPLEEAAGETAADLLGIADNSVMVISNAAWVPGRIGSSALSFSESTAEGSGYAQVSNAGFELLPPPGAPFSVSFWFNPDSLSAGWCGLAGNDPTGSNGWYVALNNAGRGTNFLVFTSGSPEVGAIAQTTLVPGQWYSLTLTYDGTTGIIYLDRQPVASRDFVLKTHDGPLFFGGRIGGYPGFHGRIDDIRTYTHALSADRLALAGSWNFDEGAGPIAHDASLNEQAILVGFPEIWVPGRNGSGLDLRKAQTAIPNRDLTLLPPTGKPFSISVWLCPRALVLGRNAVMSCGSEGTNGWELTLDAQPDATASLCFSSMNYGGTLDLRAPVSWSTEEWLKVDVTHNGGQAFLYLNGCLAQTACGAIRGSRAPLRLAQAGDAAPLDGTIDELTIFHRVREAAEIGPIARTLWETVFVNSQTNLLLQCSGPRGKTLSFSLLPSPAPTRGSVTLDPSSGRVTYSADGTKGADVFAYTVSDGEFTSLPATVTFSLVQPHWISPNGGAGDPPDGSSPERAWPAPNADALDAIWKTNSLYDCFFYAPGVYEARGWKYQQRSTANVGCKHVGSGVEGLNATTIRLVDIWDALAEGLIFGPGSYAAPCDNFELHNLILDCNANNLPKHVQGEPVWIRIPLAGPGRVETLSLFWNSSTILYNAVRAVSRAAKYTVTARLNGTITLTTNCVATNLAPAIDTVPLNVEADELTIELRQRPPGVEFYGLNEIQVAGRAISLPTARGTNGVESRLNSLNAVLSSVDNDGSTAWASGSEDVVELEYPLSPGSRVSEMDLQWHCKTETTTGRFGPAASLKIQIRNAATGTFEDVASVRHERLPNGWETTSFGTVDATNTITTDRVRLILNARESMVDHYGIREVRFRSGTRHATVPVPTALNMLNFAGARPVIRAFDSDPATCWVSGTQGGVAAVSLSGSNLKFTNLRIKGFGTKAGRECFPMYLISPRGQAGGNVLVEDVVFSQPATNNSDGVTALTMIQAPPDTLTNAVVRRCSVLGLKSHFTYSQGFTALRIEDCTVDNAGFGAYFEPDSQTDDIGTVLVQRNRFLNVDHGVYLLFHPGCQFDTLLCLSNEIVLNGLKAGTGIACCDTCTGGKSGSLTNLVALNNVIRYSDWNLRSSTRDFGLYYSDIQNAVFGNNLIVQGAGSELRMRPHPAGMVIPTPPTEVCDQIDFPPPEDPYPLPSVEDQRPGYRRAWFENRALSGALLPIRIQKNGTDQTAIPQQWPD